MSQIQIPNIRQGTDVNLRATLTDSGVHIDWSTLTNIKAYIYSEAQRQIAGNCTVEIDPLNSENLLCHYDADEHQWLGVQKLVILAVYDGQQSTYDKRSFAFVATTDETSGTTTVQDDTVAVDIDVEDVDSSILAAAIRAALEGAEYAEAQGDYAKEKADEIEDASGEYETLGARLDAMDDDIADRFERITEEQFNAIFE